MWLVVIGGALAPSQVAAVEQEIASVGPLTRIIVSADLNCQVAHEADLSFEFFGGETGGCGTFLAVDGSLFGPAFVPAGSGLGGLTPWTPVSQSAVGGNGSSGDPYRVVTVVEAGGTGIRVEQTDSYVIGEESYRTDIRVESTAGEVDAVLYRAADCFLQESDVGVGRVDDGAPACVISHEDDARIEQWLPLTDGSRYAVGVYSQVWAQVGSQQPFDDRCDCDTPVDNGAGLSWEVRLPAGGSTTISHLTFFSPEGIGGSSASFAGSIPGPGDISFDPLVLASSAALAAGVVFVVPFPSALFNSTLEQHYDEVTGWARRVSGRIGRVVGALGAWTWARIRRRPAGERQTTASDGQPAPERSFWKSPLGAAAFIGISAFVYSLLDPTLGLDTRSLQAFLGLALGLVLTIATIVIPTWLVGRQHGIGIQVEALPGTIAVAVICVIVSRVADFQPGYVYGLILGIGFAEQVARSRQGRVEGIAAAVGLAASIVSWLLLPGVREGGNLVLEAALATVVVAGLEGAVFAMLPVRFLPGERVRAWNPKAWMAILGIAAFAFFHILINPTSGYLADSERTSMVTVIGLLLVFGIGSVLFWAYFRFLHRAPEHPPPATQPPTEAPQQG